MVQLDWQRTNASSHLIDCVGSQAKAIFSTARLISIRRLAFPRMGTAVSAWRSEFAEKSGAKLHFLYDVVITTRGRTEISLATAADISAADSVKATEARLVTALLARAH